jgi:hypothetical protein
MKRATQRHGLSIPALCLVAALATSCTSGALSGSPTTLLSASPTPIPTAPPPPTTATFMLAAPGTAMPIPSISFPLGIDTGTFSVAANNAPAGTTVTVATYHWPPPGGPKDMSGGFLWISQKYSNAVTFQAFPTTSYGIEDNISCLVVQEHLDGSTVLATTLSFAHGDTADGFVLNFPGPAGSFSVVPGNTYWFELGPALLKALHICH